MPNFSLILNIGNKYLNSRAFINDGGVLRVVLEHINFSESKFDTHQLSNVTMWFRYFSEYLTNSSRFYTTETNGTFRTNRTNNIDNIASVVLATFWLCTLILGLVFVLAAVSYQNLIRKRKTYCLNRNRKAISKSRWKAILISSIAIIVAVWVAFLLLLCFSQIALSGKMSGRTQQNSSNQAQNSLQTSVEKIFKYYSKMEDVVTVESSAFLFNAFMNLSFDVSSQINQTIRQFGSDILNSFQVTAVFQNARNLIYAINNVKDSMLYINSTYKRIIGKVNEVKGTIHVYRNYIQNTIQNICPKLTSNPNLYQICIELKNENEQLVGTINTDNIQADSSIIMNFVLDQYKINISMITNSFQTVDRNFVAQLNDIFSKASAGIDIGKYFSQASTLWTNLSVSIQPLLNTFTVYNSTFTAMTTTMDTYENVIVGLLIVVIVILIISILIITFRRKKSRFTNSGRISCLIFIPHIILMLVAMVAACIVVVILIAGNFINSEVCGPLNQTQGIKLSDKMLNKMLSEIWPRINKSVNIQVENTPLIIIQPKNILSGIIDRCRSKDIGLLSAIGIKNLLNTSAIIRSPSIMNLLASSKSAALNAFVSVNPSQILPKDMISFLNQSLILISYFDKINYVPTINELQQPIIGITDFSKFLQKLNYFINNSPIVLGSKDNDLITLNSTYNNLMKDLPAIQRIQNATNMLLSQFQNLQIFRNNSDLIRALQLSIDSLQTILSNRSLVQNMFNSLFSAEVEIGLINTTDFLISTRFNQITNSIIPCENLSLMMETVTTITCTNSELISAFVSLALILAMVTIMCQLISTLIVWFLITKVKPLDNVTDSIALQEKLTTPIEKV